MRRATVSLIVLAVTIGIVFPARALAYDQETTHAALTDEAVDFYNLLYPDEPLTAEQKEWIVEGSINEDEFPRWLNHFYDPIRKIGWNGEHQGIASAGATRAVAYATLVPIGGAVLPTTAWVHDHAMQAGPYANMGGDRTWEQALKYYVDGNKEEAYRTLGHALHLLQDMTVPDHSRNDSHAPLAGDDGSPLEDYLEKWNRGNIGELDLVGNLTAQNTRPPSFNKIEDYFTNTAEYSNKHFFSKDTIISDVYTFPEIVKDNGNFGYGIDENGNEFPLAGVDFITDESKKVSKIFLIGNKKEYYPILNAYFSRLAPKAVLYGAGVIELFEKQARDALEFKDIAPHATRLDLSRVTSLFSFSLGALGKNIVTGVASLPSLIGRVFSTAVGGVKNAASDVAAFTQNIISKIQNNPKRAAEIATESAEQIENLLAGDPTDGVVIDTEEERAQLKELQNQLDDIADQVDDFTYQVDKAAGNEGRGGAQETAGGADETEDAQKKTGSVDKSVDTKEKTNNTGSKKNISSGGGGGVAASAPNLAITEIMYNASGTDDGREWIEVRNDGASSASFDDVRFLEGGTNHRLVFARGAAALAAGAYAIITDDADRFIIDYPSFAGSLFDSSFSLSNDGETLALTFNGSTFHSVSYSSSTGAHGDGNSLQLIGAAWQAATPTPGVVNVAGSSGGGSSGEGSLSATSTATSSPPTSGFGASHVVISEVQVAGADAGDEFIELYNPTDQAVDMSGWSLQYAGGNTVVTSSTVSKKNFLATSSIVAKSFYLVGRGLDEAGGDGYRGSVVSDMAHRTFSLSGASAGAKLFLVPSSTLIESETDPIILDTLDYTSTTVVDAGQSFERRAWSNNLCHSAIAGGTGEFLGNGCDTGTFAEDFEIRAAANPQNSGSFKEPRTAPSVLQAPTGTTALAVYNRNAIAINFAWQASSDFEGATSTVTYRVTNASTSAIIFNTTSTSFSKQITEVGRSYSYIFQAFDRDGMGSATSSVTVEAPSFLSALYLYPDPFATSSRYVIDLYYDSYPFIPHRWSSGGAWRLPLFYLNRVAPGSTSTHVYDPEPISAALANGIVAMKFRDCGGQPDEVNVRVRLPDTAAQCVSSGAGVDDIAFSLLEDPHLRLTLASSSDALPLSTSDYLTVAFYDYSTPTLVYGGGRAFSLVATDTNQYHFSVSAPAFIAPHIPDSFTVEFDATSSRLIARWATSTDVDTLDNLLTYEVAFSTSTSPAESDWQSAGSQPHADVDDQTFISHRYLRHVAPGDAFTIGVRAKDEFGVTSTPRTAAWQYQAATEVFLQATSTGWSNVWGQKDSGHPQYPARASLQSIVPASALIFDVATIRAWEEVIGRSVLTTLRLGVFVDDGANRPLLTNKLGEATVDQLGNFATSTDLAFVFTSPITLATSTKYWFALDVGSVSDNAAYFENQWRNAIATGDPYSAGQAGRGAVEECANNDYCGTSIPSPSADADWYLKLYLRQ
ncbi:MAG: lamin tail domain-containing protein [Candidatus Brennerbacteria bacterium]|nr:lamin tail domain-containing protein [Candidatus Brennerbacteria bacterium]